MQPLLRRSGFGALGIDPSDGFKHEAMQIRIVGKLTVEVPFSHEDSGGIVFAGGEKGVAKDPAARGDLIEVHVNGFAAAAGAF